MTNYLLDVYAAYDAGTGSPETLASALASALFEFDYSLQLRDQGLEDAKWERRFVGIFTLDGYDCDEPRDALISAVEDTDAAQWCISVYEIDPEGDASFTALAWRDQRA